MKGEEKALATFGVSICDCNRGCGTGAKASAHDVQVFACEAGLLLQLTLKEETERERGTDAVKIFMGVTAGKIDCSFR